MNFDWERLSDGVFRTRLPFLDVTVGLVHGSRGTLVVDTGSTLPEARAVAADIHAITAAAVSHVVLTHHHFDHVLGSSVFADAALYATAAGAATMTERPELLRVEAIAHGADPLEVDRALAALRAPTHRIGEAQVDLGGRTVSITHPGPGHTDHDLIVVVPGAERTVVFCGDLVEQSGDPAVGDDSVLAAWPDTLERVLAIGGPDAAYVPGHGATVDAPFVAAQQRWLRDRL